MDDRDSGNRFLMFVVLALGGPVGFVNTLSLWAVETANWFVNWFKYVLRLPCLV